MSMPALSLNTQMTLAELLRGMADAPAIPITGITDDSRELLAGNVFLACKGASSHGLDSLHQAVAAKVAAVVFDADTGSMLDSGVPMIPVPGLAGHLGEIANRWFDAPSKQLRVTGITASRPYISTNSSIASNTVVMPTLASSASWARIAGLCGQSTLGRGRMWRSRLSVCNSCLLYTSDAADDSVYV